MKTFLHTYGKGSTDGGGAGFSTSVNPLILIVEDHEDTRLMLRILLEMRGMRVVEALDGEAGVSAAEEIHPDLILMDLTLPTLDGLAAMRLIRERETLRQVPVVITSGHAHPKSQEAAFAAGCSDYNLKITSGEFDAFVEDLVATLDKFNVPAQEKSELLGILGALKPKIVEVPDSSATGTPLPANFKPAKPLPPEKMTDEKLMDRSTTA